MIMDIGQVFAIGSVVYKSYPRGLNEIQVRSGVVKGIVIKGDRRNKGKVSVVYHIEFADGFAGQAEIVFDTAEKAYEYGLKRFEERVSNGVCKSQSSEC